MPREKEGGRLDEKDYLQDTHIERLCAAVKQSRRRNEVLFLGWDTSGKPVATTNRTALSDQARESFEFSDTAQRRMDQITGHGVEPVIFIGRGRAIDRPDRHGKKMDDVLSYYVTNEAGENVEIKVSERDVLMAILENRIEWEDVNPDSMIEMDADVLRPKRMFTVILPDFKDENKHYALMFKPVIDNESNEIAFKEFVAQTISTLVKIDKKQVDSDKKGYSKAVRGVERGGDRDSGLAYDIFAFMHDEGWMDVSRNRLEQLRVDSIGKGLLGQALLLMRERGWLTEDFMRSATDTTASIDVGSMSVADLVRLVDVVRSTVERSFRE
jgi:hypothetical protein